MAKAHATAAGMNLNGFARRWLLKGIGMGEGVDAIEAPGETVSTRAEPRAVRVVYDE